jgi:hypothetical protein
MRPGDIASTGLPGDVEREAARSIVKSADDDAMRLELLPHVMCSSGLRPEN